MRVKIRSTKPMVALSFLEAGLDPEASVNCAGGLRVGNRVFHCWNHHGHGATQAHREGHHRRHPRSFHRHRSFAFEIRQARTRVALPLQVQRACCRKSIRLTCGKSAYAGKDSQKVRKKKAA